MKTKRTYLTNQRMEYLREKYGLTISESERNKILNFYYKSIDDIIILFDRVVEYQNSSNNMRFYDRYNYVRITSIILRLYDIPFSEILNLKIEDINMHTASINVNNETFIIDTRFLKYINKSIELSKTIGTDYIICDSGGNRFSDEETLKTFINNFIKYIKTIPSLSISLVCMRDSIRFENILKHDEGIGFSHEFDILKDIFKQQFITKECSKTNITTKIRAKYDLYLKWFKVFYEERD